MKDRGKSESKQSFISGARREQIIEAAIKTLDEIGYVNASLSQIAKRAGISTGLISYHFSDKQDLMNHLLMNLIEKSTASILKMVQGEYEPKEKLEAFITASLSYQGTHHAHTTALIEIVFNARTPENIPYYKLSDDDEDLLMDTLCEILLDGQRKGQFGNFNAEVMANLIQGAIGEYMLGAAITKKVDLETYSRELVNIINKSVSPV